MEGFRMQCVEDAVITAKRENKTKNRQGMDVTYYSVTIASLGKGIDFSCSASDFNNVSEGDHVTFIIEIFGSEYEQKTWKPKAIGIAKVKSKD